MPSVGRWVGCLVSTALMTPVPRSLSRLVSQKTGANGRTLGNGRRSGRDEEKTWLAYACPFAEKPQERLYGPVRLCAGIAARIVPRNALCLAQRGGNRPGDHGRILAGRAGLCLPVPLVAAARQGRYSRPSQAGKAQTVDRTHAVDRGHRPVGDEFPRSQVGTRLVQPVGGHRSFRQRDAGYRHQRMAHRCGGRGGDARHPFHHHPDGFSPRSADRRRSGPYHRREDRLAADLCDHGCDHAGHRHCRPVRAGCERSQAIRSIGGCQ